LLRSRIQEQKPKEESNRKAKKPKLPKKKRKGSPVVKIVLLLVLLAAAVGGASVYLGIINVSDYIGSPEPAKKEAPKVVATKTPPAQTAAKPLPQPAPKATQPSKPQTKPLQAPKPPAQPQTVQPPQAPPKPAQAVTPAPPSPPPEVQAKPALPAPPPVAKAETPTPAPVQPSVKSLPQAPPPPARPPVKSEPKAPPAPVQTPVVSKKVETSVSGVSYPYSVYLGSLQSMDYVKRAMSSYETQGLSTYWSKVELGAKGTWYRVFTGHFRSAQEAEAFIQQKRIKDAEVKETRYSNLIGTFGNKQGGEEKALVLATMGVSAYWIQGADGQVRLYSGAFITREGAEKNQAELNSRGIRSEIVER
jgi:cell division septation protein DedD